MSREIISVGYVCPFCKQRVIVLRSTEPLEKLRPFVISQCDCGAIRKIGIEEIQSLDVWRESAA